MSNDDLDTPPNPTPDIGPLPNRSPGWSPEIDRLWQEIEWLRSEERHWRLHHAVTVELLHETRQDAAITSRGLTIACMELAGGVRGASEHYFRITAKAVDQLAKETSNART